MKKEEDGRKRRRGGRKRFGSAVEDLVSMPKIPEFKTQHLG